MGGTMQCSMAGLGGTPVTLDMGGRVLTLNTKFRQSLLVFHNAGRAQGCRRGLRGGLVLDGSRSVSAKSARVSSALDLDGLVPDETLDALRQSGVRITRAAFAGGVVEITLKVDDLPVGEAAQMEHVKRIFGIIGSQGGEAPFLADEVVQVSEPVRTEDGAVRFRVRPAVSPAPKKFFFRGKINLTAK